jgi:conjugal transfer mating pair stabilization protein TraG
MTAVGKSLLDFIAVKESGGNYDAYLGEPIAAVGTITGRTIAEVYDFQREMIDKNYASTAVGRYQTLQRTLSAMVQVLKYDIDRIVLTPDVQDAIGEQLLIGRGLDDWLANHIDDIEFMHRLSCEWASLPDPLNSGKSHYDGDTAGNHAGRTLAEFQAALTAARQISPA